MEIADGSETEGDVFRLESSIYKNPEVKFPRCIHPYIFLSHTNRDSCKEWFARPTRWFLEHRLGVHAYLDEADSHSTSADVLHNVMKPAYQCTHAAVILSPSYRKRKYCVGELNIFMERKKVDEDLHIIPFLWQIQDTSGYAPRLKSLVWKGQGLVEKAEFLVELWTVLTRSIGHGDLSDQDIYDGLRGYCEYSTKKQQKVPDFIRALAHDKLVQLDNSSTSARIKEKRVHPLEPDLMNATTTVPVSIYL